MSSSGHGRSLRNRGTIKDPARYNEYVKIDDALVKEKDSAHVVEVCVAEKGEPNNLREAIDSCDSEHRQNAMNEEMQSLIKNKVWKLVEKPPDKLILDNRWVFKAKTDANGNISKYKARVVVQGFNQKEGIDYEKTFSPVVRLDSLRVVLTIAAKDKLKLQQFDVKTAFLNGDLEEEIYMQQPQGFSDGSTKVCRLYRSIYGLKQSARYWDKNLIIF